MAEGYISVPNKESVNVTSTSTYVKSITALNVDNVLYLYVCLYNTVPADQFVSVQMNLPNNGKSLHIATPASIQISSSTDIGKTVSATIAESGNISIRLGSAFTNDFYLYFVCPYY